MAVKPTSRSVRSRLCFLLFSGALVSGCQDPGQTRPVAAIAGGITGAALGGVLGGGKGALIGGGAGLLTGWLAGELIYKEQMHLEAEKTASRARVEEAQSVLAKYREYNQTLQTYVEHLRSAATNLCQGEPTTNELAAKKGKFIEQIDKASAGAKESVAAIQGFRVKVESKQAASTDDQERQKLLQEIEELKSQEEQLTSQMNALSGLRGQVAAS